MLATSNGARGFFINWLTDETWTAADAAVPPQPLVETLASTADQSMLTGLMLMNVAMPAGTALTHERMGNPAAADASWRTARRASLLLRAMLPTQPALASARASLSNAVDAALGKDAAEADSYWAKFLVRWGYDREQLELIREALDGCEG
jgi:phosphotransacetylase